MSSVEVRFIDYDQTLAGIRRAVGEAKSARPEIARVFLFGSFVRGDWTAESDADLIVGVRKEFEDILARAEYYIPVEGVSTDAVVYSESEFANLSQDPASFLARNLEDAVEI